MSWFGKPAGPIRLKVASTISTLEGPDKQTLRALRDATCYWVEVDRRTHDKARIDLIVEDGRPNCYTLPTGLVERIISMLDARGAKYSIEREPHLTRAVEPQLADLIHMQFDVRDYQAHAAIEAVKPRRGRAGGVIQAATGAGKTRIAAKVIQLCRVKTLFLVNTKDLLYQAKREFEELLKYPVGILGDGQKDLQDITIATVQTVARMDAKLFKDVRLVIVDECHGTPADQTYEAVLRCTGANTVIGLSASPWRDDGLDILIEAACGPVVKQVSASDLIDHGILVPPTIHVVKLPLPYRPTPAMGSDDYQKLYKAWVLDFEPRHDFTASLAKRHMDQGEVVIILVSRIEHGNKLASRIPGSVFLEGAMTSKQRAAVLDATRQGTLKCLISTRIADQGLDIPRASVLILAGAGRSSTRALQRVGRVIRRFPGKTGATVYDLVDPNYVLSKQALERLKIYRTERAFLVVDMPVDNQSLTDQAKAG